MGREQDDDYLEAPLLPGGKVARRIKMQGFARSGGCQLLGTSSCVRCPVAELIPLEDCAPPGDCPACVYRTRCPCGSDAYRRHTMALLRNG